MHMQGTPRTMQEDPRYDDVVDDVRAFLAERIEAAVAAGVAEERIWVDPGIGFGKTVEHNLELLRRLGELRDARPADRGRHLAQELPRHADRAARSASGSAARSPRTCSRSPRAPTCSASTTSPRPRQALESPRCPRAPAVGGRRRARGRFTGHGARVDGDGSSRRSRSSCAGSRSTPTTGSPTPSRRSASGSRSTSPSTCPTATRCSPTGSRTRSTTPRSPTSSRSRRPSAATGRSSGSAT